MFGNLIFHCVVQFVFVHFFLVFVTYICKYLIADLFWRLFLTAFKRGRPCIFICTVLNSKVVDVRWQSVHSMGINVITVQTVCFCILIKLHLYGKVLCTCEYLLWSAWNGFRHNFIQVKKKCHSVLLCSQWKQWFVYSSSDILICRKYYIFEV